MVQIGADTFEDLSAERFEALIDDLAAGRPVKPGPQIDRQFAAPVGGPTTLTDPSLYAREDAVEQQTGKSEQEGAAAHPEAKD